MVTPEPANVRNTRREAQDTAAAETALARCPRPLLMESAVQHYSWGDSEFIPKLIGCSNETRRPYAELWIGAHPELPSVAWVDDVAVPLDRLIAAAPEVLLGARVVRAFGAQLPFLFKVLAARQPLSIQVHPNLEQARAGFQRENRAGIPIDDDKRNYSDENHKPELLLALTDFYALRGFRSPDEIATLLAAIPELAWLADGLKDGTEQRAELYRRLMCMSQQAVNDLLDPLLVRLESENDRGGFGQDDPRFWLLRADGFFSQPEHRDRGLFSILLLNLVHLRPGQGLFLSAGELHSYLQGAGLELMANSNNVLRGGLTTKHIDVDELLDLVCFDAQPLAPIMPRKLDDAQRRYQVPATEFQLDVWSLPEGEHRTLAAADIRLGLLLDGEIELVGNGHSLRLVAGQTFLIPARCEITIRTAQQGTLYLAAVPDDCG